MFTTQDYNAFVCDWTDFKESYTDKTTEAECRRLFERIRNAPCRYADFAKQLQEAIMTFADEPSIPELIELAKFQGRTKEEARAYANKLWRIIFSNRDISFDYCFSDPRACIAFYISFGSMDSFFDQRDKDKNETFLCKRFADNYLSVNINDNYEILQNFSIQHGTQRDEVRRVVPIGDVSEAAEMCNFHYGAGNFAFWREDLYRRNLERFKKVPWKKEECLALMNQVIATLEK